MTDTLIKENFAYKDIGRRPCDNHGQRLTCLQAKEHKQPPEAKRACNRFFLWALQKRINPDTFISDIWPPDTLENKFLLF